MSIITKTKPQRQRLIRVKKIIRWAFIGVLYAWKAWETIYKFLRESG